MTVIRPNSISGVTSITAQASEINVFRSDGALAGLQLNGVNFNTTAGVSTFATLNATTVSIGGTLTYEDVTNVDSVGVITARDDINIVTDGKKLNIGESADLQLHHTSNHSYIDDAGTGNLRLRSGTLEITNLASNKTSAVFSSGSGQTLNFNNNTKFVTTNTGVVVTGVCTATSFSGNGANLTNLPVPTTITVADESSDTTCNPLFVTTTSGNLAPKTGTNLTFNSVTGNLRAGSLFVGTGTNESKTQDGLILERSSTDGEVHITAGRSGGNYGGMAFYVAGANSVTKRYHIDYQSNFRWYDDNSNQIAMIKNDGDFLVGTTSNGSSTGIGLKLNYHATNPTFNCVINQATGNHSFYHLYNTNGTHNAYRFYVQVNGGIANHSGNNVNLSDERMKKNITNMGSVYDTFKKFTFKDFNYIDDEASESKKHGLIAQDVETIDSDLITDDFKIAPDSEGNDVYRKALKEEQFMMIGMKALQEAMAKIEILEAKVETLEAKVAALEGS